MDENNSVESARTTLTELDGNFTQSKKRMRLQTYNYEYGELFQHEIRNHCIFITPRNIEICIYATFLYLATICCVFDCHSLIYQKTSERRPTCIVRHVAVDPYWKRGRYGRGRDQGHILVHVKGNVTQGICEESSICDDTYTL